MNKVLLEMVLNGLPADLAFEYDNFTVSIIPDPMGRYNILYKGLPQSVSREDLIQFLSMFDNKDRILSLLDHAQNLSLNLFTINGNSLIPETPNYIYSIPATDMTI